MQHFSDCDWNAIFGISSNNVSIWSNSYENPMQFDLFRTSSKFWHTWVGDHSLKSLGCSQKLLLFFPSNSRRHTEASAIRTCKCARIRTCARARVRVCACARTCPLWKWSLVCSHAPCEDPRCTADKNRFGFEPSVSELVFLQNPIRNKFFSSGLGITSASAGFGISIGQTGAALPMGLEPAHTWGAYGVSRDDHGCHSDDSRSLCRGILVNLYFEVPELVDVIE
jgi:hypothetical protein